MVLQRKIQKRRHMMLLMQYIVGVLADMYHVGPNAESLHFTAYLAVTHLTGQQASTHAADLARFAISAMEVVSPSVFV